MIKFFRQICYNIMEQNYNVIPTEHSDEESHVEISQSKLRFSFRNDKI